MKNKIQKINNYYDQKYFTKRDLLSEPIAEAITIFAKERNLNKILDVGCGTGLLIKYLRSKKIQAFGCDISKIAIKMANKNVGKKVALVATATSLPYKDNSFDLITSISTIEHLTAGQAKSFLKEVQRVLKTNGFIFLITPNFATPLRLIQQEKWFGYNDPTHINFFTPISLKNLLKKYGFGEFKFLFKIDNQVSYDWEFPIIFRKFPKLLKDLVIFLFFSSPVTFIRNSFWIAAKKQQ